MDIFFGHFGSPEKTHTEYTCQATDMMCGRKRQKRCLSRITIAFFGALIYICIYNHVYIIYNYVYMSPTHRIHVWYIYLHLLQKSIKCRSIYHRWMVWAMKLRGLKANNRWHIHLVERCPTCPTLSMPSFYSPKEVQAVTPGHLCFCNALKLGPWNTSWWFQPIWKILVKLDHFPN